MIVKKWDYRIVDLTWNAIDSRSYELGDKQVELQLLSYGNAGWELVQVIGDYFVFKRPAE